MTTNPRKEKIAMSKGRKSWLNKELEELERTDPAVAEARRRLDELPEDMARYERHMAARKAVGKRALPDNAIGVFAAVALLCGAVAFSAPARADDQPGPDPDLVRGMYDAGVPPAEIPHDVIRNNPRLNSPTLPWQVLRDLQDRP